MCFIDERITEICVLYLYLSTCGPLGSVQPKTTHVWGLLAAVK